MILIVLFVLSALGGAALMCALLPLAWWWMPALAVGLFIGLNAAYLLLLFLVSLCLGRGEAKRDSRFCRFVVTLTIRWIFRLLRIRVSVEGMEKLPACPMVLVSNHRSDFDPMAVLATMPHRRIAYISKESNLHLPIAGAFVRRCSFLAIDRENPRRALVTLRHASALMQEQGLDIGIYPEGTRSREGGMLPFKEGAFVMAKWAKAPIVVMATEGTERIAGHVVFRANRIQLRIVDVIPAETVATHTPQELLSSAETVLRAALTCDEKNP